ncbi:MAG: hypothetical protein ABI698_01135 [bacterium]
MFERRHEKLAPFPVFLRRVVGSVGLGLAMLLIALLIGICGYHWLGGLNWIDSLLEASMILGGMGPINPLSNTSVKVFASIYALFSGVVFIALMGLLLTPVVHRMMHKFHLKDS